MHSFHAVRCIGSASLTLTLTMAVLAFAAASSAQAPERPASHDEAAQPSQDELKVLRSQKLARPVFKNAAWRTDFDAAKAEAKKDHKLVLVYFTRSYSP